MSLSFSRSKGIYEQEFNSIISKVKIGEIFGMAGNHPKLQIHHLRRKFTKKSFENNHFINSSLSQFQKYSTSMELSTPVPSSPCESILEHYFSWITFFEHFLSNNSVTVLDLRRPIQSKNKLIDVLISILILLLELFLELLFSKLR